MLYYKCPKEGEQNKQLKGDKKMKKIYYKNDEETNRFFFGIPALHGEWLMETGDAPLTLETSEEALADYGDEAAYEQRLIEKCNRWIAEPTTEWGEWEECTNVDIDYVNGWLSTWGVAPLVEKTRAQQLATEICDTYDEKYSTNTCAVQYKELFDLAGMSNAFETLRANAKDDFDNDRAFNDALNDVCEKLNIEIIA